MAALAFVAGLLVFFVLAEAVPAEDAESSSFEVPQHPHDRGGGGGGGGFATALGVCDAEEVLSEGEVAGGARSAPGSGSASHW